MQKNFDYLGNTFQVQLLNQIIVDKEFSTTIMDVLETSYFDNKYFKIIAQMAKEYYQKYQATPTFDTLEQIAKSEISQEMVAKIVLDTIKQIKDAPFDGSVFVQEKALKFCKQQELQKAMTKAQKIIDEGDFESYDKVEELVREAIQVGERDLGTGDVFANLEVVLDDDFRSPIPIGIKGIDNLLKGGLAKGEIGVILAPTGVGKTTILKKLPSDSLTMLQIKNQLRKMIADGNKLDLVVLDYIDCVMPEKSYGDEWKSEGSVMRHFEAMCHELGLVGWTATQGNRSSISSEVVTTDQMGGSIKKAQVGHVIISVAKTLQQKELNLATIAITKSRIGKDGVVFENCKFNNELLEIDTESSVTFLGFEGQQEQKKSDRVKELLEKRKQREQGKTI